MPSTTTGRRPRVAARWVGVLGALALVAGAVICIAAFTSQRLEPEALPLPETTFAVGPRPSTPGEHALPIPTRGQRSSAYPRPNTLYIPSLGVTAPVVPEQQVAGELVIPGDATTVGRYVDNPDVSATKGTTLLAGHVVNRQTKGALYTLATVRPHALVVTTDDQGRAYPWEVVGLEVRHKDDLPHFAADGERLLAVVTCGGRLLRTDRGYSYESNVIAMARPW